VPSNLDFDLNFTLSLTHHPDLSTHLAIDSPLDERQMASFYSSKNNMICLLVHIYGSRRKVCIDTSHEDSSQISEGKLVKLATME